MKVNKIGEVAELKINSYRLMTRKELMQYEDKITFLNASCAWWLADVDPFDDTFIAYAEGGYTDEDMYCQNDEANTFFLPVLDIENISESGLEIGDKFTYCGYAFTILSDTLAICNNFVGYGPYLDENVLANYYGDTTPTNTVQIYFDGLFSNT